MKPILFFLTVTSSILQHRQLIDYPDPPPSKFSLWNDSFNTTDCYSCLSTWSNAYYCSNADITFEKRNEGTCCGEYQPDELATKPVTCFTVPR